MFWVHFNALTFQIKCSHPSHFVLEHRAISVRWWQQLLGQQVIAQFFICKVVIVHTPPDPRLWSLHLRPQWIHIRCICTGDKELV